MRLIVALCLITPFSYAQEISSEFQFLGFSDDFKYVAVETHIPPPVDDVGSESKIIFVDVEKNSWPTKPLSLSGKQGEPIEKVIARNKANAKALFATYRITPGKNTGDELPLSKEKDGWSRDIPKDTQTFTIDNVTYTLQLNSIETGEQHEALMVPKYKFELVVKYNGKTQVLQRDKTVPASRGFTTGYSIRAAYHSGPRLVVVMEYRNPGFEGYPDTYNMVVTGVLGK